MERPGGRSEVSRYSKILDLLKGTNILTVGETPGFLEAGGMVLLSYQDDNLQLDVNLSAARAAQLKLDSRLLSLAKRVIKDKEQAGI